MKYSIIATITVAVAAAVILSQNEVSAKERVHLVGQWSEMTPPVSINAKDQTMKAVITTVAKQAHWDLVIDAPTEFLEKSLTLELNKKPAADVLKVVLSRSDLTARLDNGILIIRPMEIPKPALDSAPIPAVLPAIPSADDDTDGGDFSSKHKHKGWSFDWDSNENRFDWNEEDHDNDRVNIGNPVRVDAGEEVGDAVSVLGDVTVEGHVTGDAVSVGGTVYLGTSAIVDGDAVSVGGTVESAPGAVIKGERVSVAIPDKLVDVLAGIGIGGAGFIGALAVLLLLMKTVVVFLTTLIIVWAAPGRVTRIRNYLSTRTGASLGAGIALFLCLVPATIILLITVIGIMAIPFLWIFVMVAMAFGLTAFASWLGYKIPLFKNKSQVGATLLGLVTLVLISAIPIVGGIVLLTAGFIAAGATLLSRFGSYEKAVPVDR